MFNFTTLTVLNKVVLKSADPTNYNIIVDGEKNPTVRIGNIRFTNPSNYGNDFKPYVFEDGKPYVLSVQKNIHKPEHKPSVSFDLSSLQPGNYRIALYLGLSLSSQEAFYSNDLLYKGKPLYIEFLVKGTENENVAANVVKIAKKYMLFTAQHTFLNVTEDSGSVTFEGVNGYLQIRLAYLQYYDPDAVKVDCCTNDGDFVNIVTGVPCTYTFDGSDYSFNNKYLENGEEVEITGDLVAIEAGLEAFGDYNYLIHNLRYPTGANTNFWSPNKDEMPVVGGDYVQYIVRLLTNRDGIAGSVVGQRATSVTTHVFWVLDSGNNVSNFDALFETSLGQEFLTDATDHLSNPFNASLEEEGNP